MKLKWMIPFASLFMEKGSTFPLKIEQIQVGECVVTEVFNDYVIIEVDNDTYERALEIDPDLDELLVKNVIGG